MFKIKTVILIVIFNEHLTLTIFENVHNHLFTLDRWDP